MLLWSALCFSLLALANLVVVLDMLVFPGTDLRLIRQSLSLAGVSLLLFGFIWDQED